MRSFPAVSVEVSEMIAEAGGRTMDLCYQCGTCSGTCPWNLVGDFRVRNIITLAQLGMEGYEGDDLWMCATCNACVDRCPRGVEIIEVIRTIRSLMSEGGTIPQTLRSMLRSVQANGNPWSGDSAARYSWTKDFSAPSFTPEKDICFFTCCTQAYDSRNVSVGRAVLKILDLAGVSFGVAGPEERCCGDATRKAGGEEIWTSLAQSNIRLFSDKGVKKLLVSSPHCLSSFTKEYPAMGGRYEVHHMAPFLADLVKRGQLKVTREVKAKAIYHDPCYLGRHSGIYDAPRDLLRAVPGLQIMEFGRNREDSVCCGGGGGRLWMETPVAERLSVLKLREAAKKGAEMLVTACPYCVSMFEDARTALNMDGFQVREVAEVVAEAL